MHKLDEWKTIIKQDLASCEVMESDESESGSDDDDDDDEDASDDESDDDSSEMDTD